MKPHKHIRKAKGYCCIWDDGPYNSWKKKVKRSMKRADKQIAKKEIENGLQHTSLRGAKKAR